MLVGVTMGSEKDSLSAAGLVTSFRNQIPGTLKVFTLALSAVDVVNSVAAEVPGKVLSSRFWAKVRSAASLFQDGERLGVPLLLNTRMIKKPIGLFDVLPSDTK